MNTRSLSRTIVSASFAMTAICAVLLTLCFFLSFDARLGYFSADSVLPVAFKIFYALTALEILVFSFICSKKKITYHTENELTPPIRIIYFCVGAIVSISAIYGIVTELIGGAANAYSVAQAVGALFFSGYLILSAAARDDAFHSLKLLLICFSAFYPIAMAMKNFFNVFRPSNSVENTLSACFSIAMLLYILNEAKIRVYGNTPRAYLPSLLFVFFTGASLSVSYVIGYSAGALTEAGRFRDMLLLIPISVYFATVILRSSPADVSDTEESSQPNEEA